MSGSLPIWEARVFLRSWRQVELGDHFGRARWGGGPARVLSCGRGRGFETGLIRRIDYCSTSCAEVSSLL